MAAQGFFSVESLVGVHVVVVDAERDCRDLLAAILRYCGALVTPTASAEEARNVMTIAKCDVIVVDVELPGESGIDLIRGVRTLKPEQGGVVRAIALSTRSQDEDAVVAAGFDAHLRKPLDPWALCRLVARLTFGDDDPR